MTQEKMSFRQLIKADADHTKTSIAVSLKRLSQKTKIPVDTLEGYYRERSRPGPANRQKLAEAIGFDLFPAKGEEAAAPTELEIVKQRMARLEQALQTERLQRIIEAFDRLVELLGSLIEEPAELQKMLVDIIGPERLAYLSNLLHALSDSDPDKFARWKEMTDHRLGRRSK